jgi:Ca2+/Na+ antiporter
MPTGAEMADRNNRRRIKVAIKLLAIFLVLSSFTAMVAFKFGYADATCLWIATVVVPIAVIMFSSEAPAPPPNALRRLPKPPPPILSKTDVEAWRNAILVTYKDNHEYVRHHESQRSTASTLIVTAAGAAIAASLYDRSLTSTDIAPLLIVMALGVFGILFSGKQYERTRMHVERIDALMDAYAATLNDKNVIDIIDFADGHHRANWGTLRFLPVNRLWFAFHIFLIMVGAALLLQVSTSPTPIRPEVVSAQGSTPPKQ